LGLWTRIFGGRSKAAEGSTQSGPYALSEGWLPAGSAWNFWQMGKGVRPHSAGSAMVEACVSAYAQTVAMCPGDHWRRLPNGGRERVPNSPLARMIRRPNDYQSISDFLMNATRELYQSGEFFALAIRDGRGDIIELHLMRSRSCFARVAATGEIFYSLGGNPVVDQRFLSLVGVPARDVLHVRLHTPVTPLRGESPLLAAALDIAATDAALMQQITFLRNEAKPSIMLATDATLTREQTAELRAAWDLQTRGENAGGTPILTSGLKPVVVSGKAVDAQVAELMKMSAENIALAFRVPLQILGIGGTPYASTELLMQSWISSGLGFALNHIEEAMGHLFGLSGYPDEYVEFNTAALQRSAFKDRIEALAKSVISGMHSPDEARNEMDLPTVPGGFGKEPRVQQQVVPLSYYEKLQEQASQPAPALPAPADDDTDKAVAAFRMKFVEALNAA
jgi:HK97 family phage portal protein